MDTIEFRKKGSRTLSTTWELALTALLINEKAEAILTISERGTIRDFLRGVIGRNTIIYEVGTEPVKGIIIYQKYSTGGDGYHANIHLAAFNPTDPNYLNLKKSLEELAGASTNKRYEDLKKENPDLPGLL